MCGGVDGVDVHGAVVIMTAVNCNTWYYVLHGAKSTVEMHGADESEAELRERPRPHVVRALSSRSRYSTLPTRLARPARASASRQGA
jgi:hypothetical protein